MSATQSGVLLPLAIYLSGDPPAHRSRDHASGISDPLRWISPAAATHTSDPLLRLRQ
jgi:hypothetical protein